MNVTVANNDGTYTVYRFSPEHTAELIGEYTKMVWNKTISGFAFASDDNSQTGTVGNF